MRGLLFAHRQVPRKRPETIPDRRLPGRNMPSSGGVKQDGKLKTRLKRWPGTTPPLVALKTHRTRKVIGGWPHRLVFLEISLTPENLRVFIEVGSTLANFETPNPS